MENGSRNDQEMMMLMSHKYAFDDNNDDNVDDD